MALLFRLRSTNKVYNATTGTTAASDGGAVGSWEPTAGLITTRALHATKGPTYRSNDNASGFPGLEWSAGKLLTMAHSTEWTGWTSFSWMAVVRNMTTSSANRYLWSRSNSGAWSNAGCRMNIASYSDPIWTFHDAAYSGRRQSTPLPTLTAATRYVMAGSVDATKMCSYINRQSSIRRLESGTVSLGTSGLTIGEDYDSAGTYNLTQGVLFELAFWDSALTEAEMATEIDTAMTTWSVSNTVSPPSTSGGLLMAPGMFGGMRG